MQTITPDRTWPLHDVHATRQQEARALAATGQHVLMQRAGLSAARLALALAPHAHTVWIACGPGNNGGDGLEAAMHLQQWGKHTVVQWLGNEAQLAQDAAASLRRALAAGVSLHKGPAPTLQPQDLCIDALLGLGGRAPAGDLAACVDAINNCGARVLAIDLPTGLDADSGGRHTHAVRADDTLSLLTLKPGLFTGHGRDLAGQVWFDDLEAPIEPALTSAWLSGPPPQVSRPHASNKGSFGDVAVIGGGPGMQGAAVLAATAALHSGAGRVYVSPLDGDEMASERWPELMWRTPESLPLTRLAVACGCGGGTLVHAQLPQVLSEAAQLVLDADALNALSQDLALQALLKQRTARGQPTVLTPHPLEAARLLAQTTLQIQADRLGAAQRLADRFGAVVILKGSGSIITAPGHPPRINPTGNARLATAGTGDVLAGMVAARMAAGDGALDAACAAVFHHGAAADRWPTHQALTASALAHAIG
jgi:hydroxyethylthiazole kinase-like uncharacterized protein yjeF